MKNKKVIKIIVDCLMFVLMLLEFSKIYTGQLLHEIFGIVLFLLFVTHNILNINFYKNLLKGNYNFLRVFSTIVNILFLLCMVFTIILGIPISNEIFKSLNLNGNMTIRKLHTILGYWNLVFLSIHLGLHFNLIFAKLKNKVKDKKAIKALIYLIQFIIVIIGIKQFLDMNFGAYLIGKSSFAKSTNIVLSLLNNFVIVTSISIIIYNFEKILKKKEGIKNGKN